MAKVQAPLMSLNARGSFGKNLVYSNSRGRNVVRKLTRSANPRSINQQQARNYLRVANECVRWAAATDQQYPMDSRLVRDMLNEVVPAAEGWNQTYVSAIIGKQGANYAAAEAQIMTWGDMEHESWEAAADAMTPPIRPARQVAQRGAIADPIDSGRVFFHAMWGLFVLRLIPQPSDVPPIFS